MSERRRYQVAMAGIACVHLAAIWALPVLPAQDLPQHLAYARIFQDPAQPAFAALYQLPSAIQPYHVPYLLLASLGRVIGLMAGLRLLFTVYVLGLLAALHALAASSRPPGDTAPPWPALLGAGLVWSPVAAMGFLSFLLCVPLFLWGAALLLRAEARRGWGLALAGIAAVGALLASLHLVAAAAFVALALLHALLPPSRRKLMLAALALVGAGLASSAWQLTGGLGVGHRLAFEADAVRRAHGVEFVNDWFRIEWSSPPVQLNYILWTLFGPYRVLGQAVVGAALALVALVARRGAPSPHRRWVVGFALLGLLAPFGLYVPSEVTFINLRLLTLAAPLAVLLLDPRCFSTATARRTVVAAAWIVSLHFAYRAHAFAEEARPALRLLAEAKPGAVLSSLVFEGRSRQFGKTFRVNHFLPMYYTVLHDGACTQFWARYAEHLPIAYRPGHRPAGSQDWHPETFARDQLRDSQYLILGSCDPDDDPVATCRAEARARRLLGSPARCDGRWCLYALAGEHAVTAARPGGDAAGTGVRRP